jgi:hypothetical protein
LELKALEGARQDLELSHAVLIDKLKQTRAENERLLQEVERFRARITNANKDFVSSAAYPPYVPNVCSLGSAWAREQESHSQAAATLYVAPGS